MRIQKTYIALAKALIEMMEDMPFENIRVKDLCERTMIRKSTFYKHFADKYELLAFVVKATLRQTDDNLVHSTENSGQFILILNILSQQVTPNLCEKIEEDQRAGLQLPASPAVMASFFAGAIVETVRQWISNGKRMPEAELEKQLYGLVEVVYRSADQ